MRRLVLLPFLAALVLAAPAAGATQTYTSMRGAPAPGPSKYDKVWVAKIGPSSAKHVFVMVPGTTGAAGSLTPVGGDIQRRLGRGWQVWVADRREVAFQDVSGLVARDPAVANDYYLGFKYRRVVGKDVPFTRRWGMAVAMNDLHRVVQRARAGGRRQVVLGGHSLGASEAITYASWDFSGRAGYRDLAGVVLIDGGELGAFSRGKVTGLSLRAARKQKRAIDKGEPFGDILGIGIPEIAPIFATVASLYAAEQPDAVSALQDNPIVPAFLRPPVSATNEAFLGNIFDADTSPPQFGSLRFRGGRLASSGDPRPWVNGEKTTIPRFSKAFSAVRPTAAEWYFPRRLSLDSTGADTLRRDKVTKLLGLRTWHTAGIDVPLYAYQTDLTHGGVVGGARNAQRRSRIPRLVTIDDSGDASHLDPAFGEPAHNRFLKTVLPFLRRAARGR